MTLADATVISMAKWARKASDVYPTPPEATHVVAVLLGIGSGKTICEPACGDGAIARVLEAHSHRVISSDLRDTGYGIGKVNFLGRNFVEQVALDRLDEPYPFDALVTNPPFNVAEKFIRKAVTLAPVVAFLLKSNFWNTQGRLKLWDACTPTAHHPLTWRLAFLEEERGKSPLMDCDWWIWDKSQPKLPCRPLPRPHLASCPEVAPAPFLTKLRAAAEARERLNAVL